MNDALLSQVAWIGDKYVNGPVRGIVLEFPGLGGMGMKGEGPDARELEWGQAGALVVVPFQDPWGWMNPQTVAFTDELVAALFARFALAPDTPVIATGGSMGGHGALIYTLLASRPVAACAANCPVCDLPFHYGERPDLPRTMHHAFGSYGDISAALVAHSPWHQAARMPDVPYLIIHGDEDRAVGKAQHSDKLVAALRGAGRNVEYVEAAGMAHCGPFDWALHRRWTDFVLEQLYPVSSEDTE
jgi:alpha-beta hydrolase superfamily lysophospholipase